MHFGETITEHGLENMKHVRYKDWDVNKYDKSNMRQKNQNLFWLKKKTKKNLKKIGGDAVTYSENLG